MIDSSSRMSGAAFRGLTIVIVNWNSGDLLRECLASLEVAVVPAICPLLRVVVVDNASTDASNEGLRFAAAPLQIIRNATNRGFAAACNQGAADADGHLLLFLNPDTRLNAGSLVGAIECLDEAGHSQTGIVGIRLLDPQGRTSRCCARFPTPSHFLCQSLGIDRLFPSTGHLMREWDHAQSRFVDQVIGAYFLVRRTVYDALNGFDERFFVYFEEVDFARRARGVGWACFYLAGSHAMHVGGGSTSNIRSTRLFYSLRSRLAYSRLHFSKLQHVALVAVTWTTEPLARCILAIASGRWADLVAIRSAYRQLRRLETAHSN